MAELTTRDDAGGDMRAAPALVAIVLLVLLGLGLRLAALGGDPSYALSASNAEVMDGPWYLAEAIDEARGTPVAVPAHYRLPIITWTARPFFVGGVSLARAHAWAAAWGALLVLLGAAAAWTAFGRREAVLAAVLLSASFVLVGYGRAPVVYGPLAAGLAGVAWLHALGARRWFLAPLAWVALAALAIGVKDTAVVAAPALVLGHVAASRRPWRMATIGAALAVATAVALAVLLPGRVEVVLGKVQGYFGADGLVPALKRCFRGAFASGLLPKSIVVAVLGWLGLLAAARARPEGDAARARWAFSCMLGAWFVSWPLVFGAFDFQEPGVVGTPPPPLRYFIPALVPAALLGASWLAERWSPRAAAGPVRWWVAAPWAGLGAYWFAGTTLILAWRSLVPEGGKAPAWLSILGSAAGLATLAGIAAVLAAALAWRRGQPVGDGAAAPGAHGARRGVVLALVLAFCAVNATRLWPVLTQPERTLAKANELTGELLGAGARAIGTWSHALTYAHPTAHRYLPPTLVADIPPTARSAGITHLIIDEGWMGELGPEFARQGVPLSALARVQVREHPVMIYRMAWAEEIGYELTRLETAIEARRRSQ